MDSALQATGTTQRRVRLLPARTMIYFILALILYPHASYTEVFTKLTQHTGLLLLRATSPALAQARIGLDVKPLRWLFGQLRGPEQTLHAPAFFGRYRACAIDGTILPLPDTPKILAKYHKQAGNHGGTGYPQARLLALVDCATRSISDAVFGPTSIGETTYAPQLVPSMRPDMLILADRNFASAKLLHEIAAQGAGFLVRVKNGRNLPVHQILTDGSYYSTLAGVPVRVLNARITLHTDREEKT
nr:IS4 family transposase [Glutamicibacter protophormiae]